MHLATGQSKLFALFLLLFSFLAIGLSLPTNSIVSIERYGKRDSLGAGNLAKRISNWDKFKEISKEISQGKVVGQGDEEFMEFGSDPATLGSVGFQGCFGVVVLGTKGVILGHYNTDKGSVSQAVNNIPSLFKENEDKLADANAYLFAAVDQKTEKYSQPLLASQLEDMIKDKIGKEPIISKYTDPQAIIADKSIGDDGDIDLDKYEEWSEKFMDGEMLVKHPGGDNPNSEVLFVHLAMQKSPDDEHH